MNKNEEYKNSGNKEKNIIEANIYKKEINNTDIEKISNKSYRLQSPLEILSKFDKNKNKTHTLNIHKFNGNESGISLETFKTMFKNKHKELKEYKESLDRKIEILKSKINSKKSKKGRNNKRINISVGEINNNESTLKDNNINNSQNKKNYGDSLLFTLKGANLNQVNITSTIKNSVYNMTFDSGLNNIAINFERFYNSFFGNNSEKPLFSLLSLLNSNDLFKILNINKVMKMGIINFLKNEVKEKIIPKFIKKYCDNEIFIKNTCKFCLIKKQYKKNKKAHIRIILTIKSNINENNPEIINKKHQILYQVLNPKKLYKSTFTSYSYEIVPKEIPKRFWIYKEYTSFHYDDHDKAYYNDLIQFWPGDQILINIGLISELGLLDFDNFHWLNPKIVPKINKSAILDTHIKSYLTNSENTCEVEGLINGWLGIERLDNYNLVVKTLYDLFGNFFSINEVFFEDVGYYFFKVILQAKNLGECNGVNNNLGIKIIIHPKDKKIFNEIKKNGLIYDENNELNVNIDDIITFYISQNK